MIPHEPGQPPEHPPDEERALWVDFKTNGSRRAREKLFSLHQPFARQIARGRFLRRTGGDIELPDLQQLACAGLLEAIDRFDPRLGTPFRGYAARRIHGSILDGVAKMSELREQISFRNRARAERARSLVAQDAADLPAADALSALIDAAIGLALGFMLEGTGLYAPDDRPDPALNAYESLAWKEAVEKVAREVDQLPERERAVVSYHYVDGLGFEQIGALLGVTKGRISQLHKAALDRLRKRLPRAGAFRLER